MNILITRTKRKKTISIQVKNGNIEVKAPFGLNQSYIESFIQKKEKWIKNKIDLQKSIKEPSEKKFIEGEIFKFLGEDLVLKINIGNKKAAYVKNEFLYSIIIFLFIPNISFISITLILIRLVYFFIIFYETKFIYN